MSYASAAQHYYDPPDPEPICDICDERWDYTSEYGEDWNGESGCHFTCEEQRDEETDDEV